MNSVCCHGASVIISLSLSRSGCIILRGGGCRCGCCCGCCCGCWHGCLQRTWARRRPAERARVPEVRDLHAGARTLFLVYPLPARD
ncbi:hypothetical protein T492DRAFT_911946 [Pavlovales sp. CCMP2436]|nr:hypothetical protein T492DRAFT_911946 [Pavlovales sp. CCMP2436]